LLIAVTGWGAMDGRDESGAAGFDHHLTKPVDLSTLRQVVAVRRKPAR
jgi:CheY-like chemotaxis protein